MKHSERKITHYEIKLREDSQNLTESKKTRMSGYSYPQKLSPDTGRAELKAPVSSYQESQDWGAQPAQSVGYVTLDAGVMSLRPM